MRFLKWLGFILIFICGTIGATIAVKSWDRNATHPALVNADLPPLIPMRDFFADQSSEWGYRISPSGKLIVNQAIRRTKRTLIIRDLETRRELASISDYSTYFWNPHEYFLHVIRDKRMWKIDPAAPAEENWQDVTPLDFQNGYRIEFFASEKGGRNVVAAPSRHANASDLYLVDADGRNKEPIAENEGRTLFWILNKSHTPEIRADRPRRG